MAPERSAIEAALPHEIRSVLGDRQLTPVCRTEIRRGMIVVDMPAAVVEVSMDHRRIVAGDRVEPVCEIELELKQGRVEGLFELARELIEEFPLRPSIRSKSSRGYDLAGDSPPAATKAPSPAFDRDETMDKVLREILKAAVQHLLENQPAAEDGRDPEGLHQYRVALRRLMSLLGLIRRLGASGSSINCARMRSG